MAKEIPIVCSLCGVGCNLELVLNEGGVPIKSICSGRNRELKGRYLCIKGFSIHEILTSEERLVHPGAKEYYTGYVTRYGKSSDYHGAEAYSALLVVSDALKRAKSFSPKDIRDALNKTYIKMPFGPVKFYSI